MNLKTNKMKKLFLIPILILTVLSVSCEKETILIPDEPVEEVNTIPLEGTWVLRDAKMYVENLETGELTVYSHFDATQTTSSLRFSGAIYEFETITQNVTTWTFHLPPHYNSVGEFWLDMDSLNAYGLNVTTSGSLTIVEHPTATAGTMQLGGSARPIRAYIADHGQNLVNFYVQEAYENIGGYNCKYFSELTFEKL